LKIFTTDKSVLGKIGLIMLYRGGNIAESFFAKKFGNIGTFGNMGTKINFFVQKMKNA
jgi:hypothetical protein